MLGLLCQLCFNDGLSNSEFVRGLINFKEEGKDYSYFKSLEYDFCSCFGMMFLTTIVGAFACIVVKQKYRYLKLGAVL